MAGFEHQLSSPTHLILTSSFTIIITRTTRHHVFLTPAFETQGRYLSYLMPKSNTNIEQVSNPQTPNPMHQQQTRTASTSSPPKILAPRNQMEAMPPSQIPGINQSLPHQPFNPATVHPVFFSEAWRKAPFPMPGTAGFSPVATGYVFGSRGTTTRQHPSTKL
jgi:hypothetical protein